MRRDFGERFDNAEDMLRDWRKIFDQVETRTGADPFDVVARRATREMAIAELGYSVEAQNVLDLMGIHNVRELLAVDRVRFRYLKSVGDKVRKEIRATAKRLAQIRPDLVAGAPTVLDADAGKSGIRSIDELANHLFAKRAAADERPDDDALAFYLGLEAEETGSPPAIAGFSLWPSLGDAARAAKIARPTLTNALVAARARWLKSTAISEVRDELAVTLLASGGVMSVAEAATSLLASHGSIETDDATRLRLAAAILRAVIETEADRAEPRYQGFAGVTTSAMPLIAAGVDHTDYALRLGAAADAVIAADAGVAGGENLPTPPQVSDLQDVAGRAAAMPSVWLLAPMDGQGLPTLDGVPIPVITQAQWARIPEAWIDARPRSH